MKVLIISNFFHPTIHIASFRIEAFAKYLSEAGFEVTIVTEGDSNNRIEWNGCTVCYIARPFVESLRLFKNSDSKLRHYFRACYNVIYSHLFIDNSYFWGRKAYRAAKRLMEIERFDIVLSSYGYHSPLRIAQKLKKDRYSFKWILDMRDEMSKNIFFSERVRRRLKKYEQKYLSDADLVLSVSSPIINGFMEIEPSDKYLEIKNGYDFPLNMTPSFNKNLVISYVGSFYGKISPDNLFRAIESLKNEGKLDPGLILRIIGNRKPLQIPSCLIKQIEQIPRVPHDAAIAEMVKSDVLLIIHPTGRKGVYTGKLFDYLGANRYILALADPSDVIQDILSSTNSGITIDNDDIEGIKSAIIKIQKMFHNKSFPISDYDKLREYSRKNQVGILVNYIKKNWSV